MTHAFGRHARDTGRLRTFRTDAPELRSGDGGAGPGEGDVKLPLCVPYRQRRARNKES